MKCMGHRRRGPRGGCHGEAPLGGGGCWLWPPAPEEGEEVGDTGGSGAHSTRDKHTVQRTTHAKHTNQIHRPFLTYVIICVYVEEDLLLITVA